MEGRSTWLHTAMKNHAHTYACTCMCVHMNSKTDRVVQNTLNNPQERQHKLLFYWGEANVDMNNFFINIESKV